MARKPAPYGTWKSPLTPESFTERTVSISQLRIDDADIYWVEDNPQREGRSVLLRRDAMGQTMEALPLLEGSRLLTVQTDVHGRGGRAYAVRNGLLVVSDGMDGRVYLFRVSDRKRRLMPLTPLSDCHYGDFEIDLSRGIVYAVREDRRGVAKGAEPVNSLVAIPLDGSAARSPELIKTVFEGTDFVSAPVISHDATKLTWLTWNHPNMPWTESELHVGALDPYGMLLSDVVLVDHPGVCVYEPRWTLDGDLIHIDDSTGWANFYRTEGFDQRPDEPHDAWQTRLRTRALHPASQAFSQPHWLLGSHTYDNLDNNHLVCTWVEDGEQHLGTIRLDNGLLEEWRIQWWPIGNVAADSGQVIFLGDSATKPASIVEVVDGKARVIRPSSEIDVEPDFISRGAHVEWRNRDGKQGHGLLYQPNNPEFEGEAGTKPPLLVTVNAIPTTQAKPGMDYATQYWTSRGFAVLKVNPRGSSGWGRDYRNSLNGKWGLLDVSDCIDATKAMIKQGNVDPARIAIRGQSFGAATALNALEQSDLFSTGVAFAGMGDVRDYARNAHKFETNYPRQLVGSFDLEDSVWDERDPLSNLEKIEVPVLFIHGGQDTLAPVEQVQNVYDTLKLMGKPVALEVFHEEGHEIVHERGIQAAWNSELDFYGKVWGIDTGAAAHVEIANWDK